MPPKLNLLLVDDNSSEMRLMLEAVKLSRAGEVLNVHFTYEPEKVLRLLDTFASDGISFDIIFLDLNMAKLSGKDLLVEIKRNPLYNHAYIFLMSNSGNEQDFEDCLDLGAAGAYRKPEDFSNLLGFFSAIKECIISDHAILPKHFEKLSNSWGNSF